MNSMPDPDFSAMSAASIAQADTSRWIAVLPLGAHEQHGPHLPCETDTLIAAGIVDRLKKKLPSKLKVTFLPVEPVGYSPEHLDWPQTRSLAYDEAINRWIAKGEYLNSLGIRKLVLLNAHGGNSPLMTIVATELRTRFGMLCAATAWTRFERPQGLIDPAQAALDIHGGDIETSVMLALHPEQVDMRKARRFPSDQAKFEKRFKFLRAYGRHAFGWKMQDLNPQGAAGNAKSATASRGEQLIENAVAGLVDLIKDVDKFDLSHFDREPKS
ncbi:MAG: creatininase family protein [Nitratireductor sp.]|nr:creatininase family protein [Nitratireductor sp.]MCC0021203.1 creatininase family protein [Nitratireductor sp.]